MFYSLCLCAFVPLCLLRHSRILCLLVLITIIFTTASTSVFANSPEKKKARPAILLKQKTSKFKNSPVISTQIPNYNISDNLGITTGINYLMLGQIALVSSVEFRANTDFIDYYLDIPISKNFQLQYVRQECVVKTNSSAFNSTTQQDANIYVVKYTSQLPISFASAKPRFNLGSVLYIDKSNSFTQTFFVVSSDTVNSNVSLGFSAFDGDASINNGIISSASYILSPEIMIFANYNTKDFNKLIVNDFVLSKIGVDCSTCSKDAFSVGLSFRLDRNLFAALGLYDIYDLRSPFGNLFLNWR